MPRVGAWGIMHRMTRRAVQLGLLLCLAMPHAAAADAQLARQAVAKLADEARTALKDDQPFPRSESDYAKGDTETLTGDEVLKLLMKKLDRNPTVDAYIKWQLLSYEPDLAAVKPADAMRLIAAMPAFEPAGRLDKPDHAFVKRYANRDDISAAHARKLIEIGQRFHHAEDAIIRRNEPNDAYHAAVIDALPDTLGLKLHAIIHDTEQRMRAGNRSWASRVDNVLEHCEKLGEGGKLPPAVRTPLKARLKRLTQVKGERIVNFNPKAGNRVDVTTQNIVFGKQRLRRAYDGLDGKPRK